MYQLEDLSTDELVNELLLRLANTNGMEFVSIPALRKLYFQLEIEMLEGE